MASLIMKEELYAKNFNIWIGLVLMCSITLASGFTISTTQSSNYSVRAAQNNNGRPGTSGGGSHSGSNGGCGPGYVAVYENSKVTCVGLQKGGNGDSCSTDKDCAYGTYCQSQTPATGTCKCSEGFTLDTTTSNCVLDTVEIQAKMTKVIIALAISAIVLTLIAFALILYGNCLCRRKVTQARRSLHARTEAARRAAGAQIVVIEDKPPAYDDLSKVLQQSDEPAPPSYDQALRLSTISSLSDDVIKPSDDPEGVTVNGLPAEESHEPSAPVENTAV